MMKKIVIILFLTLAVFTACQNDEGLVLNPQFSAINPADLPNSSKNFIDNNFTGEIVTDAFRVVDSDQNITYEAFMSNNTNLVFDESDLCGFGNINSSMELEGEMFNGGMHGSMQNMGMNSHDDQQNNNHDNGGMHNGGMNGNGGMQGTGGMQNGDNHDDGFNGMMGDGRHEYRNHPEVMPEELYSSELPSEIVDYLNANYPDKEILKAFVVVWDDENVEFHVLIQDVGALLFDKDGNFIDMIRRGGGHCEYFEDIDIAELPDNILEYVDSNYPDDEIIGMRLGLHNDDTEQIHVMLDIAGILVFDSEGNFIELMERRMRHHG